MADVIEMIQLSPTMEEGVLVEWLKKEGDTVATGDLIAEVETDKATMEMESFFDGVVLKLLAKPGDAVRIGAALAIVGEKGEDVSALLAELAASAKSATDAGRGADSGGTEGGKSASADAADVSTAPASPQAETAAPAASTAPRSLGRGDGRVLASPLARKLAADKGFDVAQISGSGPQGRVVKRDVENHTPSAAASSRGAAAIAAPAGEERVVKLSQMRNAIARTLQAAWQAPAFMLTREIAMGRTMDTRKEINAALADDETGIKISVNDFIIKACAMALIDVPEMNSAFEGDSIRLYGSADIGVAVAIEGGLITPIVRRAEAKTLTQIAVESRELAQRARARKLQPDEFTGATFSLSNLGMFGIDHFTAVLNPPAAGILAVGQTKRIPVVDPDGQLTVGQRMNVTLTCDHRAVDGAVGANFLIRFARYMETPSLMLV